jgi:hypothetical protein
MKWHQVLAHIVMFPIYVLFLPLIIFMLAMSMAGASSVSAGWNKFYEGRIFTNGD